MNLHCNGTMNTLLTIRGEIISENVKILSFTVSTCSHSKPCYPGACNANSKCKCSEGFGGYGCRNCEYTMTYFYFTCFLFTVIILYKGGRHGIVVVGFKRIKLSQYS